jgi:hypothetical protein
MHAWTAALRGAAREQADDVPAPGPHGGGARRRAPLAEEGPRGLITTPGPARLGRLALRAQRQPHQMRPPRVPRRQRQDLAVGLPLAGEEALQVGVVGVNPGPSPRLSLVDETWLRQGDQQAMGGLRTGQGVRTSCKGLQRDAGG